MSKNPEIAVADEGEMGLVDASGRPISARRIADRRCPQCGAAPEKRVASSGFGVAHPVCGRCGHEFVTERWE